MQLLFLSICGAPINQCQRGGTEEAPAKAVDNLITAFSLYLKQYERGGKVVPATAVLRLNSGGDFICRFYLVPETLRTRRKSQSPLVASSFSYLFLAPGTVQTFAVEAAVTLLPLSGHQKQYERGEKWQ